MPETRIQLVCFDLGGVLMRLCNGWNHACSLAGVTPCKTMTDDDANRLMELVYREEVGELAEGEFFVLSAPLLGLSIQDARAMSDAWLCGAYPGVDTLIQAVHDAGLRTACLSNTNDNHWRAMIDPEHRNGLPLNQLTHRFASHLVRDRKPNASIYRYVEEVTGLPSEAILFFDDALENIQAAQVQGWHVCQVTDIHDPVSQMTSHLKRHNLI